MTAINDDTIFIVAPREVSQARFKQIVKRYLPKAPIVLGVSKEPYVVGLEGQPQFAMLDLRTVQPVIDRVNAVSPGAIRVLAYSQSELADIVAAHRFKRILLVNGSWHYTFQNHPAYQVLLERNIPFKYLSPFVDEDEAHAYEQHHSYAPNLPKKGTVLSDAEMLAAAAEAAKQSYDYSFQTGASLGRRTDEGYAYLFDAFNKVVPYQSYALHHGNSRERHGSEVHDTTHYDTIHAEMHLLIRALENGTNLKGTTLFINLLPCPSCARTLTQTGIDEIVYVNDHSGGYGKMILEASGKNVRQHVTQKGDAV